MAMPSPRLPPVTITLRMRTSDFARLLNTQTVHNMNHRGDFVPWQRLCAELKNFGLNIAIRFVPQILFGFKHDIGDHERASNRTLSHPHQRHAYAGMA